MHVLMVISSLHGGGAERVAAILANTWSDRGTKVSVLTFDETIQNDAHYALHPDVSVHRLGGSKSCTNKVAAVLRFLTTVKRLRGAIRNIQPDVVVAFMAQTNIITLLACEGLGLPVLVSERCHPGFYSVGRGWAPLRKIVYRRASSVVVQTRDVADWCSDNLSLNQVDIIPNPVMRQKRRALLDSSGRKQIVAAGRLTYQKGFDLLIKSFSMLAGDYPDWDLVICGEGEERVALETMVADEGLNNRIQLARWNSNLLGEFADSDMFVLCSRFEGFPNVLCEAMSIGLPVVSYDCPSGPGDIIRDGEDGYLVEEGDWKQFARQMGRLMQDESLRRKMGESGREVAARYSPDRIIKKWDEAFSRFF